MRPFTQRAIMCSQNRLSQTKYSMLLEDSCLSY